MENTVMRVHNDDIISFIFSIIAGSVLVLPMDTIRDGITWNMISASLVCRQWWKCMCPLITSFTFNDTNHLLDIIRKNDIIRINVVRGDDFITLSRLENKLSETTLTAPMFTNNYVRAFNKLCKLMKITKIILKNNHAYFDCNTIINPNLRLIITHGYYPFVQHDGANDMQIVRIGRRINYGETIATITYTASDNHLDIKGEFEIFRSNIKMILRSIDRNSVKRLTITTFNYDLSECYVTRKFRNLISAEVYRCCGLMSFVTGNIVFVRTVSVEKWNDIVESMKTGY